MIVCICNAVDDVEVHSAILDNKCRTLEDIQEIIPICNQCLTCKQMIQEILDRHAKYGTIEVWLKQKED